MLILEPLLLVRHERGGLIIEKEYVGEVDTDEGETDESNSVTRSKNEVRGAKLNVSSKISPPVKTDRFKCTLN